MLTTMSNLFSDIWEKLDFTTANHIKECINLL